MTADKICEALVDNYDNVMVWGQRVNFRLAHEGMFKLVCAARKLKRK